MYVWYIMYGIHEWKHRNETFIAEIAPEEEATLLRAGLCIQVPPNCLDGPRATEYHRNKEHDSYLRTGWSMHTVLRFTSPSAKVFGSMR